jgi:hypothetical protein
VGIRVLEYSFAPDLVLEVFSTSQGVSVENRDQLHEIVSSADDPLSERRAIFSWTGVDPSSSGAFTQFGKEGTIVLPKPNSEPRLKQTRSVAVNSKAALGSEEAGEKPRPVES